jgi:hypothetical protein
MTTPKTATPMTLAEIADDLRENYPAVDVTKVIFSADFSGVGCCVIPQDRVLEIIAALRSASPSPVGREREALIKISDADWRWSGGGSDVRHRGDCGRIAAQALGISEKLKLGWPDPTKSETRAALAPQQQGDGTAVSSADRGRE